MKKTIRVVALVTTIGLSAMACQKDPLPPQEITMSTSQQVIYYRVGSQVYEETLNDELAIRLFWQRIFAMAREGYEVDVFNGSTIGNGASTKEVISYTTESEEDATKWANKKTEEGYLVRVTFKDGVYTCTAIK